MRILKILITTLIFLFFENTQLPQTVSIFSTVRFHPFIINPCASIVQSRRYRYYHFNRRYYYYYDFDVMNLVETLLRDYKFLDYCHATRNIVHPLVPYMNY